MANKKKKLRYPCWKCDARFISWQKRNAHARDAHPTPIPEKPQHVNFVDLVRHSSGRTWGKDMLNNESKHASMEYLSFGMLVLLGEKLDAILEELRKPKMLK